MHVEGEIFFAAAELFYEQIRRVGEDENLRVLVLVIKRSSFGRYFSSGFGRITRIFKRKKLSCIALQ